MQLSSTTSLKGKAPGLCRQRKYISATLAGNTGKPTVLVNLFSWRNGTTDVTRTLHFGTPTEYEKKCFTLVLKGNISLGTSVFPEKTSGLKLDVLARAHLWKTGLDYRHGTGHGVGHFLNVHEGPQGIGMRSEYNDTSLCEGMTVTNGMSTQY